MQPGQKSPGSSRRPVSGNAARQKSPELPRRPVSGNTARQKSPEHSREVIASVHTPPERAILAAKLSPTTKSPQARSPHGNERLCQLWEYALSPPRGRSPIATPSLVSPARDNELLHRAWARAHSPSKRRPPAGTREQPGPPSGAAEPAQPGPASDAAEWLQKLWNYAQYGGDPRTPSATSQANSGHCPACCAEAADGAPDSPGSADSGGAATCGGRADEMLEGVACGALRAHRKSAETIASTARGTSVDADDDVDMITPASTRSAFLPGTERPAAHEQRTAPQTLSPGRGLSPDVPRREPLRVQGSSGDASEGLAREPAALPPRSLSSVLGAAAVAEEGQDTHGLAVGGIRRPEVDLMEIREGAQVAAVPAPAPEIKEVCSAYPAMELVNNGGRVGRSCTGRRTTCSSRGSSHVDSSLARQMESPPDDASMDGLVGGGWEEHEDEEAVVSEEHEDEEAVVSEEEYSDDFVCLVEDEEAENSSMRRDGGENAGHRRESGDGVCDASEGRACGEVDAGAALQLTGEQLSTALSDERPREAEVASGARGQSEGGDAAVASGASERPGMYIGGSGEGFGGLEARGGEEGEEDASSTQHLEDGEPDVASLEPDVTTSEPDVGNGEGQWDTDSVEDAYSDDFDEELECEGAQAECPSPAIKLTGRREDAGAQGLAPGDSCAADVTSAQRDVIKIGEQDDPEKAETEEDVDTVVAQEDVEIVVAQEDVDTGEKRGRDTVVEQDGWDIKKHDMDTVVALEDADYCGGASTTWTIVVAQEDMDTVVEQEDVDTEVAEEDVDTAVAPHDVDTVVAQKSENSDVDSPVIAGMGVSSSRKYGRGQSEGGDAAVASGASERPGMYIGGSGEGFGGLEARGGEEGEEDASFPLVLGMPTRQFGDTCEESDDDALSPLFKEKSGLIFQPRISRIEEGLEVSEEEYGEEDEEDVLELLDEALAVPLRRAESSAFWQPGDGLGRSVELREEEGSPGSINGPGSARGCWQATRAAEGPGAPLPESSAHEAPLREPLGEGGGPRLWKEGTSATRMTELAALASSDGQPATSIGEGQPATFIGEGQPTTFIGDGQPTTSTGDGQPATFIGEGQPATSTGDGQPATFIGEGQPATSTGEGQPATSIGDGQPATSTGDESNVPPQLDREPTSRYRGGHRDSNVLGPHDHQREAEQLEQRGSPGVQQAPGVPPMGGSGCAPSREEAAAEDMDEEEKALQLIEETIMLSTLTLSQLTLSTLKGHNPADDGLVGRAGFLSEEVASATESSPRVESLMGARPERAAASTRGQSLSGSQPWEREGHALGGKVQGSQFWRQETAAAPSDFRLPTSTSFEAAASETESTAKRSLVELAGRQQEHVTACSSSAPVPARARTLVNRLAA
ncbi:hypothetical protein CYMTET_6374 [Cymbomonas tetramitiformis]|uniref:Uncharacterized protein n=1 Tax=Cymbomonas tetramitiformis TaxID=36881 RepID=A0AAE0GXR4_9CHLO|nr:hypothetical protein CYMTET_6374 [Cymbomonas tetramitiformis]